MKIIQKPEGDAGLFIQAFPWRAVLHTTEGHSLPIYNGTNPHATLDLKNEILYQHCDWHHAAKALIHPNSVETNRARAVQFELIGFAADSHEWPKSYYDFIHRALVHARHQGCNFRMAVATPWDQERFSVDKWRKFDAICGHRHVPGNDHTDPGARFRAREVLG